jgi:hypothetical protein
MRRINIYLQQTQYEYMKDHGYNISLWVREQIDKLRGIRKRTIRIGQEHD